MITTLYQGIENSVNTSELWHILYHYFLNVTLLTFIYAL